MLNKHRFYINLNISVYKIQFFLYFPIFTLFQRNCEPLCGQQQQQQLHSNFRNAHIVSDHPPLEKLNPSIHSQRAPNPNPARCDGTTEQSGNLLNMLMCRASSAMKSPLPATRYPAPLNSHLTSYAVRQGGEGYGVLASYVQHPKCTTCRVHSRIEREREFRTISSGECWDLLSPKS